MPAQQLREALAAVARPVCRPTQPIVLCAKGIERDTGKLLSAIVDECCPSHPVAALSGPSFATDVASGPADRGGRRGAATETRAAGLAGRLSTEHFRCYSTDDLIGVEVGGALKNVLAIAAGTVVGAGLGASAQAAMVTRGFVELRRIAASFGARPGDPDGPFRPRRPAADLQHRRSRAILPMALALGRGEPLAGRPLAEGVATAAIAAAHRPRARHRRADHRRRRPAAATAPSPSTRLCRT